MRRLCTFLTLCCLAAGCATAPAPSGDAARTPGAVGAWRLACSSELPPELCAAVVAGAVRRAAPFGDPEPRHIGAPVTRRGDAFVVTVVQREGELRLVGDLRLSVQAPRCDGQPLPRVETDAWLDAGAAAGGATVVQLTIAPAAGGSRVDGTVHDGLRSRVQPQLERALHLASVPTAATGSIDDSNLARLVAHRLLVHAATLAERGDLDGATPWLHNAVALGADGPRVHLWLADLAHRRGRALQAREHRWQALLATDDARARSAIAAGLEASPRRDEHAAETLLRAARTELARGNHAAAADLLHSARRVGAAPARDYRLQQLLSRMRGDPLAALASSLLAREHAPWRPLGPQLADDLRAAGLDRLADLADRRLAGNAARPQ